MANCTTPAQYFHLLRRQAKRNRVRPLVILTPKSLLRLPQASSRLAELTSGTFQPVLDDPDPTIQADAARVTRVALCTGKVYYDLLGEAAKLGGPPHRPALVRIEGLHAFLAEPIRAVLARYPAAREFVWVQDEPRNMGAWSFRGPAARAAAAHRRGASLRGAARAGESGGGQPARPRRGAGQDYCGGPRA